RNFSDGTTDDCTNQGSWTSGNNAIAQVSDAPGAKGVVTALSIGNTSIIVTLNGVQGSAAVTETAATLTSITITDPTIAKGTTVRLTATGNFSDGSTEDLTNQVSWTSANNAIAQVSDAAETRGVGTALGIGSTSITATLNGVQGSAAVTVTTATLTSITITPPVDSIAKGTAAQLFATCNFSDGTTEDCTKEVGWTSANNAIARVSD